MLAREVFKIIEADGRHHLDWLRFIDDFEIRWLGIRYYRALLSDVEKGIHPRIDPELEMLGSQLDALGIDVPHWKIPRYVETIYI